MGVSIWEGNKAERVAAALEALAQGGGGGGTSNYNLLTNKPSINNVTLSGNITLSDLGIHGIPSGGSTGQVLGKVSDSDYEYEWITASASGGSASILIAASNSAQALKDKADFVCTGENDQITINNAMSGMSSGEICILAGDYYISGPIEPTSNVDIKGFGNPQLHLTDRVITTLSQAASVDDETIYLTDPSDFVVGQKIVLYDGTNYDYEVGTIKTINYETGAVTMYPRGRARYLYPSQVGKVSVAMQSGATVFTDSCVIMGWNKDNVTISNLLIDGNSNNLTGYVADTDWGSNIIEWSGGNNVRVLNNKLTNCYKHSVLFVYGTSNSYVCQNVIDTAVTHGIDFYTDVANNLVFGNIMTYANIQCHGGLKTIIANNILSHCSIVNYSGQYNLITGNRIDNIGEETLKCIFVNGSNAQYTEIIGNNVAGGYQGIQLDSNKYIKVFGNKFSNQRKEAIHFYKTTDCIADSNDVYAPNSFTNGSAIKIENASTGTIICGNTVHGTSGKTLTGIEEAGTTANYNTIANNIVYNATTGVSKTGANSVEQNNIAVSQT